MDRPEYDLGSHLQAGCFLLCQPSVGGKKADQERWNRNGGVLMAELTALEELQSSQEFRICDLNGDGFIDREEFHSCSKRLDGRCVC